MKIISTKGKLPKADMMKWASKLKARQNPFLAPSQSNQVVNNLSYGSVSAGIAASFNVLVTDRLPSKFHLPVHSALALSTLLLPRHSLSAGLGGALFYAFFSETYYSIVKKALLDSANRALNSK